MIGKNQSTTLADEIKSANPSDPYNRLTQTFPQLDESLRKRICPYGEIESGKAGDVLYDRGQRNIDFFVLLEGAAEVLEYLADGTPHAIAFLGPGHFSGELTMFNNRGSLAAFRLKEDSRFLRVPRDKFRRLLTGESELGELITRAFILRRTAFINHGLAGVTLSGPARDANVLRIQQFLRRNGIPVQTTFSDSGDCHVRYGRGQALVNPSNAQLGQTLGFTEEIGDEVFDVTIVGAGPAGLSAAVYSASEGLCALVLDSFAPGGQAGSSSKIENYMGFPAGISGQALSSRAQIQSQKFGARISVPHRAVSMDCDSHPMLINLDDGSVVKTRSVIIASGAHYRKLNVDQIEKYEGSGIHYAATAIEAALCTKDDVAIVGAGNSAGQAAMFLSERAKHVHMLVRGPDLRKTMSEYLVSRIEASSHITVHLRSEVTRLEGEHFLEHVTWKNAEGTLERHAIGNLFLLLGAIPNTEWLTDCLDLDDNGFVICGRNQSPYQTSRPGIFAVGDVRSGSVKRVASAVGEGSVVVSAVHAYLAHARGG